MIEIPAERMMHGKVSYNYDAYRAEELEARAAMLNSLARSQQALARILDSVADISEQSPHAAKLLRDQAGSLTAYQESIAETITGLGWRRRIRKQGQVGKPWLQPKLRIGNDRSGGAGGEKCAEKQGQSSTVIKQNSFSR